MRLLRGDDYYTSKHGKMENIPFHRNSFTYLFFPRGHTWQLKENKKQMTKEQHGSGILKCMSSVFPMSNSFLVFHLRETICFRLLSHSQNKDNRAVHAQFSIFRFV